MNSLTRIALIAVAASTLAAPGQAQRLPRNSFVRKPVYSITQLIEHVKTDPVVLKRYLRHYSGSDVQVKTKEDLIRYFRTLKTGKIMKTEKMKIYRVNKYGVIDWTMQTTKAGTLAFFDPNGRPMLIKSCGNPTKYPFVEIPPRPQPPQLILMENPVPTEVVPGMNPLLPPPPGPVSDLAILPPLAPMVPDVPTVERRRSFIPIPIPIPFTRTRTREIPPIPGPAAAVTFIGIAVANRLRRKRNA
ncbi:MAG: hypothetical protein WAO58_13225 [Fimbriimonadaceae bacterium]